MFRLLSMLLLATALAACGNGDPTPSGDGGASDASTSGDASTSADAGEQQSGDAGVVDCFGKANGIPCGEGSICLADRCRSSRCGDGFINTDTGEQCEDGNETGGDGCTNCRFDCDEDADCDDQNPCTENVCQNEAGKRTCQSTQLSGTCELVAGGSGVCNAGACVSAGCGNAVREGDEECDDGNADDTDGCRADCTFTCESDAECDDRNPCTGTETCDTATHTCKAGIEVTCAPGVGCGGACDPRIGACRYADNDRDGVSCATDCNDADPAIYPGAFECKDGKDNDCNAKTSDSTAPSCLCYADSDNDGYSRVGAATITAVTCPDGYTRREPVSGDDSTIDCREGTASAHPGQVDWFDTGYCTNFRLDPGGLVCIAYSFDYNCDGVQTQRYTTASSTGCSLLNLKGNYFCLGSGWTTSSAPACGKPATYRTCTAKENKLTGAWTCVSSSATTTQQCH